MEMDSCIAGSGYLENPTNLLPNSGCNPLCLEHLERMNEESPSAADQARLHGRLGNGNASAERARTPERDRDHLDTTFGHRPTKPFFRPAQRYPIFDFRSGATDSYIPSYSRLRAANSSRPAHNSWSSPAYESYEVQAQRALERKMADLDVRDGGDSYRGGGNRGGNRGHNNNRKRRHDGKLGQFLHRLLQSS